MSQTSSSTLRGALTVIAQIVLICAVWWAADALSRHFLPMLPGGVLGMLLVLAGLLSGRLPLSWLQGGARWLLAEMLLFFIPAAVAAVQFSDLAERSGLRILLVIVVSTVLVMASCALAVDFCYVRLRAWRMRRAALEV